MILQRLAWAMLCNRVGDGADGQHWEVSQSDAELWISPHLARLSQSVQSYTASQTIDYLIERTSIIRAPARGRIDFPHRTFQEYLAACAAGAENQFGILADHVGDDKWRETIVLAAGTSFGGIPFGNRLIEVLLEKGESSQRNSVRTACFALALACCDTARQVTPDMKERVLTHLKEIAPPYDFEMADMLASAGDAVLSWLEYGRVSTYSAKRVAAAARTLARIGTESAASMLIDPMGYGGDDRATVSTEACSCPLVHPAQLEHVRKGKSETAKRLLFQSIFEESPVLTPAAVASLKLISEIDFSKRRIDDLTALAVVPLANWLQLRGNPIQDLTPLKALPEVRFLDLSETFADTTTLPPLASLRYLVLDYIRDVRMRPLTRLPQLKRLEIAYSKVADPEFLSELIGLETVDASSLNMSVEPLSELPKLRVLWISKKQLPQMTQELKFPALRELGVRGQPDAELLKMVRELRPRWGITCTA